MPKGKLLPAAAAVHALRRCADHARAGRGARRLRRRARATRCSRSRPPERMTAAPADLLALRRASAWCCSSRRSSAGRSSRPWRKGQPHPTIDNLNARIKAWWVMVLVIGLAFVFGRPGVILLFAFISFFALREFMTLTYTRRGDYWRPGRRLLRRAAGAVRAHLHRLVRAVLDLHPGLRVPAAADPRRRSPATPRASSSARRRSSGGS